MKDEAIDAERGSVSVPPEKRSDLKAYIAIARPDHWTKNIFILPGLFLAQLIAPRAVRELLLPVFLGTVATCLISSANYTINEWLDRHFDRFHPKKRSRSSVAGNVSAK